MLPHEIESLSTYPMYSKAWFIVCSRNDRDDICVTLRKYTEKSATLFPSVSHKIPSTSFHRLLQIDPILHSTQKI